MNSCIEAIVAPIDRVDVDTDAILPKQYMRSIERTGYGDFLFDEWRYLDPGELGENTSKRRLNPDFILNQARYAGAGILLCRRNFGSGSAREHAVWAIREYGIQALIAPSFGDIFFNNCLKNNVLPIALPETDVEYLFEQVATNPGYRLKIDLAKQTVRILHGRELGFMIDAFRKRCLLENLDDISFALAHAEQIRAFEVRRRKEVPWLFTDLSE
jgi:3-isopropylmalate/(R)-2-methylmalate dehydratase small subunit